MLEIIKKILNEVCGLSGATRLVVGVSGGTDSVCLLDCLQRIGYQLVIAHMDHQLRPTSSEEARWVEKLAGKYQAEFRSCTIDIRSEAEKMKKGVEETARNERYKFLFSVAEINQADAVVIAHQADDQVETILMNIIRGCGLDGLTGMSYRSISSFHPSIPLIRPLLGVWREDVTKYCAENNLKYWVDESNQDKSYFRNRVRQELIPLMCQYNPNFKTVLLRMRDLTNQDRQFLDMSVMQAEKKIRLMIEGQTFTFELSEFMKLDPALQRLVLKRQLEKTFSQSDLVQMQVIEQARRFFNQENRSLALQSGKHLWLLRENQKGIICSNPAALRKISWPVIEEMVEIPLLSGFYPISQNWQLAIERVCNGEMVEEITRNSNFFQAFLDEEKLASKLMVRRWQPGDRFRPMGMDGRTIKISDFWINKKLPKRARSTWPLVYSADELVWIPGFQPAHITRVRKDTRSVIWFSLTRIN